MNHALETHLQPARGRWLGVVTYSLYSHLALVVGYPISDFLKKDKRKTSVPALASMRSLWTHACITQVFSLGELATCKCFSRVPRIMTLPFSNSKMLHSNFKGTCTDSFWINFQIMGWRCWSFRYVSIFSQILCPPLYVCVGAWDAGIFVSI